MDRIFSFAVALGLILSTFGSQLSAQETAKTTDSATHKTEASADLLILSGTLYNSKTGEPIEDITMNLEKFGEELHQASMDKAGGYVIALKRDELGGSTRIIFKVPGYKKFIAKHINRTAKNLAMDIYLEPETEEGKSTSRISYSFVNDGFNTMIVKF
jgi:sulfite exporter TauE/SafE